MQERRKTQQMKPDRVTIIISLVAYFVMFAFSYGVFSQRISNVEVSLQEIRQDVHELRGVMLEKK
jgi:hypothetical protein